MASTLSAEVGHQSDDAAEEGGPQLSVHGHRGRHQRLQLHDGRGARRGRRTHTPGVGELLIMSFCPGTK